MVSSPKKYWVCVTWNGKTTGNESVVMIGYSVCCLLILKAAARTEAGFNVF
jgi:hypothetical protein